MTHIHNRETALQWLKRRLPVVLLNNILDPVSFECGLTHMGMRAYDRIPVVRYNRNYMLPALTEAGKVYADRLENGFDMYY